MKKIKAFTMPKWGIEMTEGRIAEWMVSEGKPFSQGAVLTAIETEKITNDVEAESAGRFARIIGQAGETYPVGALLAVLADEDVAPADIDAFIANFNSAESAAPATMGVEPPAAKRAAAIIPDNVHISPGARLRALDGGIDVSALAGSGRGGRITAQDIDQLQKLDVPRQWKGAFDVLPEGGVSASPIARRLARMHNIPLDGLAASGPRGRISKADVMAGLTQVGGAALPATPAAGFQVVIMTPMRKAIARRLSESKSTIPHFYLRRRVRLDQLMTWRARKGASKPTINDCIVRACALALMKVPEVNIQVHGGDIHRFAHADIGVAVATDRGLITPIIFGADDLSLSEISATMRILAERGRAGKLRVEEYSGGSFTVSNLGGHGVEQFDAIINPPQGAILAVGAARAEPVEDNGAVRIVPVIHLSLSCDHRAIDGADGGRFLAVLADFLEDPGRL